MFRKSIVLAAAIALIAIQAHASAPVVGEEFIVVAESDAGSIVGEFIVPVPEDLVVVSASIRITMEVASHSEIAVAYGAGEDRRYSDMFGVTGDGEFVIDLTRGLKAAASADLSAQTFEIEVITTDKANTVRLANPGDAGSRVVFIATPKRGAASSPAVEERGKPDLKPIASKFAATASPNPFNPETTISFEVAKESRIIVDVYNIAGRKVSNITDTVMPAGTVHLRWDGKDTKGSRVASGVYFYRVVVGIQSYVGKMTVLK